MMARSYWWLQESGQVKVDSNNVQFFLWVIHWKTARIIGTVEKQLNQEGLYKVCMIMEYYGPNLDQIWPRSKWRHSDSICTSWAPGCFNRGAGCPWAYWGWRGLGWCWRPLRLVVICWDPFGEEPYVNVRLEQIGTKPGWVHCQL
jgi:hypothetical protein